MDVFLLQTLRVGWEQLVTSISRNINEIENQVRNFLSFSLSVSICLNVDSHLVNVQNVPFRTMLTEKLSFSALL